MLENWDIRVETISKAFFKKTFSELNAFDYFSICLSRCKSELFCWQRNLYNSRFEASDLLMSRNQMYHIQDCFPRVLYRSWRIVGRIAFLIKSLAFIAVILRIPFLLVLNVQNQSELIWLITWELIKWDFTEYHVHCWHMYQKNHQICTFFLHRNS